MVHCQTAHSGALGGGGGGEVKHIKPFHASVVILSLIFKRLVGHRGLWLYYAESIRTREGMRPRLIPHGGVCHPTPRQCEWWSNEGHNLTPLKGSGIL